MTYFSQLDLTRVFERAARRANLPLYFTQGFNKRVKLSFSRALKLGTEGIITVSFYFTRPVCAEEVKREIFCQIPPGLNIID